MQFGFIDFSGPTPVDYTEGLGPAPGMTDAEILGTLALWFNQDYSSDGFTASYDPTADSLSIDQTLPNTDWLYEGNSDTGMNFSSEMDFVPEPTSALLISATLVGSLVRRRRSRTR